jgi:hypothetical protein
VQICTAHCSWNDNRNLYRCRQVGACVCLWRDLTRGRAQLVDANGERRFNFDIKENQRGFEGKTSVKNKTRVWTFCSAKGCEADVVVVFGLEMSNPAWLVSLNQISVGLSRAKKKLVVVHARKWSPEMRAFAASSYFPAGGDVGLEPGSTGFSGALHQRSLVTQHAFAELQFNGAIHRTLPTDLPTEVTAADSATLLQVDQVYSATEFTHFSALAELEFLRYGEWTVEVSQIELPARIEYETEVTFDQTVEDVSALCEYCRPCPPSICVAIAGHCGRASEAPCLLSRHPRCQRVCHDSD